MTNPPVKQIEYEVAVHTVKIQRSGQAINIDEMRQIQGNLNLSRLTNQRMEEFGLEKNIRYWYK